LYSKITQLSNGIRLALAVRPGMSHPGILESMPRTGRAAPPKRGRAKPSPSTRPRLAPTIVSGFRRRRILDAFAELCAEQGYEATTITDLAKRGAVARKSIYDQFSGKEAVLLAAFDRGRDEIAAAVREACAEADGDWPARVEAGLAALLAYVAESSDLAWLCVFETRGASPAGARRYEQALDGFVAAAVAAAPPEAGLPDHVAEALLGGVVWVIQRRLAQGGEEGVEELLPELTEFMLAPYRATLKG
jgi:AcrR family transcriptional regulator